MEDWKIKIAVLWLIYGGASFASFILGIFEPDVLQQFLTTGEVEGMTIGPEILLIDAIFLLVPLVMAFLSLTLKDSTNRWANIIVGIVFAVLGLVSPIGYLAKQSAYVAYVTLIGIVGFVAAAMIVWFAWKSKQKA